MTAILFLVVFVLLVGLVLFLRRAGGGSFPWLKFYTKGKECGFSIKEVNLLRKVAVESRLTNPTSLFWSIKQLNRSIKGIIIKFRAQGREEDSSSIHFLSKLFDFRKVVELNLPKYKLGLAATKKIATHQRLKITMPGLGTYYSQVVENLRKYLAISYPQGPKLPDDFIWKGQKINIYFWRQDDAGYVFQTKVIEDFLEQKYPILHISHSESLIRSQKRGSIRVEVSLPASLYPLSTINSANEEVESANGLKCRLMDFSEDGAALLIGGKAKVGLAVKVQFILGKKDIVMCGVVKGANFNQKRNQSILHVQGVPLKSSTRNHILIFIYNLFGDRETEKNGIKKAPVR